MIKTDKRKAASRSPGSVWSVKAAQRFRLRSNQERAQSDVVDVNKQHSAAITARRVLVLLLGIKHLSRYVCALKCACVSPAVIVAQLSVCVAGQCVGDGRCCRC